MSKNIKENAAALCRQLRNRRVSLGISQMSCALDAGISQQYLVRIESGRQNVSLDIVTSLCTTLGLTLVALPKEVKS